MHRPCSLHSATRGPQQQQKAAQMERNIFRRKLCVRGTMTHHGKPEVGGPGIYGGRTRFGPATMFDLNPARHCFCNTGTEKI